MWMAQDGKYPLVTADPAARMHFSSSQSRSEEQPLTLSEKPVARSSLVKTSNKFNGFMG
jgi:hypothetical protein